MTDLFYWIISGIGALGCVYQLYLHDWNLEELLYGHTQEDEMDEL